MQCFLMLNIWSYKEAKPRKINPARPAFFLSGNAIFSFNRCHMSYRHDLPCLPNFWSNDALLSHKALLLFHNHKKLAKIHSLYTEDSKFTVRKGATRRGEELVCRKSHHLQWWEEFRDTWARKTITASCKSASEFVMLYVGNMQNI